MRPVVRTRTLAAGVAGAVCASQTPAGAGNLLINGSLAAAGAVNLGAQQQIGITSAGNDSGVNFTIAGTDANGTAITETLAGPNVNTVKSGNSYLTITQISVNGAAAAALTVDTVQSGADQTVPVDRYLNPGNITVSVEVVGVVNYTVQWCVDDPFNTNPANVTWYNAATNLVTASTSQAGSIVAPVGGVRLVTNSGGGTAVMRVLQSGAVS